MKRPLRSHPQPPMYPLGAAGVSASVTLAQIKQYEDQLAISFTQMTDNIADAQVPESAVTQHEAALAIDWTQVFGTPTTLAGYGIADAYTEAEVDALIADFLTEAAADALFLTPDEGDAAYATLSHTHPLSDLTDWPADDAGVLTNDGAGNLTWEAAGAGTLDGTGTAGNLTRWTDSDTLQDSILTESGGDTISLLSTGSAILVLSGAAGGTRDLRYQTSGSNRWLFRVNSTAESGGNAGSNFVINRRADDGSDLGDAIRFYRSSGASEFLGNAQPGSDNALDLGVSGAKWRKLFVYTVDAITALQVNSVTRINTTRPTHTASTTTVNRGATTNTTTLANLAQMVGTLRNDLTAIGIFA